MRRPAAFLLVFAALAVATSASASLRPLHRSGGEREVPLLRAGTLTIPKGHSTGRVRVVVRLADAPLAAYSRGLQSTGTSRLDTGSASSRAYLARLRKVQRLAAAALRRAIPEARVSSRFQVVLNGLTVTLPAARLPALVRMPLAKKVYPSVRYTQALNRSPDIIAAQILSGRTGARGDGIKIGVVDDGVDQTNAFFDPKGFSYPPGFPKGGLKWTSPKVIVARAFPGPGAGRAGRIAVDRRASFHGTHVAGIAAGNSGTTAPRAPDRPRVEGLSGVAPRAWIGNYRVFTVPTPVGNVANTPEIIAAFEEAVSDGMDVINFSGGGAQSEPTNDALIEAVANVAAAGVVPVISAGNDREEFGLGSAGSPGTAPEAISVAAVSNTHVFATALSVTAADVPAALRRLPFQPAPARIPDRWDSVDQALVDVGTIVGRDGNSVDRRLCGSSRDPNNPASSPLPARSLRGVIALASRGTCSFVSKGLRARAAGAIGLVLVNNRPGEAGRIPVDVGIPAGMIADLDGAQLRAVMERSGGRTQVRIESQVEQLETGRSGIVTSFSSAGPTDFEHELKPDVSAPGGEILSSTLREFAGSPFAVFDGTSMSAPHVAGAAALLRQRHPAWTPRQVKSALVSTAGPAWGDTARTVEAPVVLEGGGLVNLPSADEPRIFTDPVSLSFGYLNVRRGAQRRTLLLSLADAGNGAGTWQVQLRPQSASAGAVLDLPASIQLAPGGIVDVAVAVRASADASAQESDGLNYGFIVLRRGDVVRRVPYLFVVTRPGLQDEQLKPRRLRRSQTGDTRLGVSRVARYRFPSAPFGPPPDFTGPPMNEAGTERLYITSVNRAVANMGVAVVASSPGDAAIHPWFLGSRDENDVEGYAGTPVNVNGLTFDYLFDVGAAGTVFPRQGTYYISVDSGGDFFTGRSKPGRYLLRSWVNDVRRPTVRLVTRRVAAGRPVLLFRVLDAGAGVNPYSLVLAYGRVLLAPSAYDPASGLVLFALPDGAPAIRAGRTKALVAASDYQEAKNVSTSGADVMPNTRFQPVTLRAVAGPAITWITPDAGSCVAKSVRLTVLAGATRPIAAVSFFDGKRRIRSLRRGGGGIFTTTWPTAERGPGRHLLRAIAVDRAGKRAEARRVVRVARSCR